MGKKLCTVRVGNETKEYEAGVTYQQIAEDFQERYAHQIVLVFVNQFRLQELDKTLKKDCEIQFLTTGDPIGHETYKRSLCFMLVKAVHDVGGHDKVKSVRIHFSVSKGYYCTLEGDVNLTQEFLEKVDKRMKELVKGRIPIEKRTIHTTEAIDLFRKHGMYDKERLFEYRRVS